MSTFATVQPSPAKFLDVTTTPSVDDPPMWISVVTTVLTCALPIALLILYWIGRVKCERVITLTVWAMALASVLVLAWFGMSTQTLRSQQ